MDQDATWYGCRPRLRILLLRFNRAHWFTFLPEFHVDMLRYKEENKFIVPVTKHPLFSPPFCTPLAQGAKLLTLIPVKYSTLRFGGLIRKKPILSKYAYYAVMHIIIIIIIIIIVAKSPATINPIIPSNNTSIIRLYSHSKCIANGHSYKADRICQ